MMIKWLSLAALLAEAGTGLAMTKWKRQNLKMKREIENIEWRRNPDIHKFRFAEAASPLLQQRVAECSAASS